MAQRMADPDCADGFVLADDGCCVLPASEDSLNVAEVALNIAASVAAGEVRLGLAGPPEC